MLSLVLQWEEFRARVEGEIGLCKCFIYCWFYLATGGAVLMEMLYIWPCPLHCRTYGSASASELSSSVEATFPCPFLLQSNLVRGKTWHICLFRAQLNHYPVCNWLRTMMGSSEINKSIIQEFNVWESSTREEFLTPCLSDTWWHCMLNVLWCLLTSAPILGSGWSWEVPGMDLSERSS